MFALTIFFEIRKLSFHVLPFLSGQLFVRNCVAALYCFIVLRNCFCRKNFH